MAQNETLKLSSEKYFTQQLRQNLRKQRNAKATQLFANLVIMTVAAVVCFIAIKTMPDWLPTAEASFHEWTNYHYF